jgi:hypothetical protein
MYFSGVLLESIENTIGKFVVCVSAAHEEYPLSFSRKIGDLGVLTGH